MDKKELVEVSKTSALGQSYILPGERRVSRVKSQPLLVPSFTPPISKKKRSPLILLPDDVRRMGIYILAGRGSGKSRLMGRVIGWQDFYRGIPQVIFDPVGSTISNLIDKILWQPLHIQKKLWSRILYVDMSGKMYNRAFSLPLYYRLGSQDSYSDIARRYLDAIRRLNPKLQEAPILGWNAILKVGVPLGKVLAALDWQITEAAAFLADPSQYAEKLRDLAAQSNDRGLGSAVDFFLSKDASYWQSSDWQMRKSSLETEISLFLDDDSTMAMLGANQPAIDWQEVMDKRLTVLLDFRGDHNNRDLQRFKMLWAFLYFLSFLKHRGEGRHEPIALIVDEITALYNFDTQAGSNIFAADLDDLVNIWSRNANCWLTLSHQERWQIPTEKSLHTLWSLGTKVIGNTSSQEAAEDLARELFQYDPYKVKRYERIWMSDPLTLQPYVIDENPVEFTPEEQQLLHAYQIKQLKLFHFLVKPARSEGDVTGHLRFMDISGLDRGVFPNEALVVEARRRLSLRGGLPIDEALAEIDRRQDQRVKPTPKPATLANNAPEDDLPESGADDHQGAGEDDWWEEIAD